MASANKMIADGFVPSYTFTTHPRHTSDGHYGTYCCSDNIEQYSTLPRQSQPYAGFDDSVQYNAFSSQSDYYAKPFDPTPPNFANTEQYDTLSTRYQTSAGLNYDDHWPVIRELGASSIQPHRHAQSAPFYTPEATEADARKHGIPSKYSLKHWDPNENPILFLGSVFDANSLGEWIYRWTLSHHGHGAPISTMAGELWVLLIEFAHNVKLAKETVPCSNSPTEIDLVLVEQFNIASEGLMKKLRSLLKVCETRMLKPVKTRASRLSGDAGIKFVETLFGQDQKLRETVDLINELRRFNLKSTMRTQQL